MGNEDWNQFLSGREPDRNGVLDVVLDELGLALAAHGIGVQHSFTDEEDGWVVVSLGGIQAAGKFLTLVTDGCETGPGSFYDRVTNGCVSFKALSETHNGDTPDELLEQIFETCWTWVIHPHIEDGRVGWHVNVTMSSADAARVTATLNKLRNEVAL